MALIADGIVKLLEEMGELSQVAAKRLAYFNTDMHPDGKSIPHRMEDEMADVLAAIEIVSGNQCLDLDYIAYRKRLKVLLFSQWELENMPGFPSRSEDSVRTLAEIQAFEKTRKIPERE